MYTAWLRAARFGVEALDVADGRLVNDVPSRNCDILSSAISWELTPTSTLTSPAGTDHGVPRSSASKRVCSLVLEAFKASLM